MRALILLAALLPSIALASPFYDAAAFRDGGGTTGNLTGPASATDNAVTRFDGTTGTFVQNSPCTISDTGTLTCTASVSGGVIRLDAVNSSNTASSDANVKAQVAGTSAGDPFLLLTVNGATSWSTGIDNSDSDNYEIAPATSLTGTPVLTLTTAGAATLQSTLATGGTIAASASSAGTAVGVSATNTENANAASNATLTAAVGGTSGGDPFVLFSIPSGSSWSVGADNSDSDNLEFHQGSDLTGTPKAILTTGGVLLVGATAQPNNNAVKALVREDTNLNFGAETLSDTATVTPTYAGFRQRAGGAAVQSGDALLSLKALGGTGSSAYQTTSNARIVMSATETFSPTANGTKIAFSTVDNTTTTLDDRYVIEHDGTHNFYSTTPRINLNTTTANSALYVGLGASSSVQSKINLVGDTTYTDYGMQLIRANTGANANSDINFRGTGTMNIGALDAGKIILFTNSTERYQIGATGEHLFSGTTNTNVQLASTSATGDVHIELGTSTTGNHTSYIDLTGDTTYSDYGLRIIRNSTGADASTQIKARGTGGLYLMEEEAGPIYFYTTNTLRATVAADGVFYINPSATAAAFSGKLDVRTDSSGGFAASFFNDGNNQNRGGLYVQAGADDGSGSTNYLQAGDGDSTTTGVLGTVAGVFAATDVSDARRKRNIVRSDIDALSMLRGVGLFDFTWKDSDVRVRNGFVAQDMQKNVPDAVAVLPDGYLGITRTNLIPILVRAVQQLEAKNDDLEQELAELKAAVYGAK